jgi:hypothetical protein
MQSASGKQTTMIREEARGLIKRVCNANEDHACIFTGTGATAAVNLFVSKLKLKETCEAANLSAVAKGVLGEENSEKLLKALKSGVSESGDRSFCKKNRWGSYECTLCKVILPSIGAYEKHAQTYMHQRALASL